MAPKITSATGLQYPLIFMQMKKNGAFDVVEKADSLGVTLERAVKLGVPIGFSTVDFTGRCHEVVAIDGYQPLESRLRALLDFRSRLVRANLILEERPALTIDETRKLILRAFRTSTSLKANPQYGEIVKGVNHAQNFDEIRETMEANLWKPAA